MGAELIADGVLRWSGDVANGEPQQPDAELTRAAVDFGECKDELGGEPRRIVALLVGFGKTPDISLC